MARIGAALCCVLIVFCMIWLPGCLTGSETQMAIIVTQVYNPPETITYDPKTGEVTVSRQFEARGAYPQNALAIGRTDTEATSYPATYTAVIPSFVTVNVYKDPWTTYPPTGLVDVVCHIANIATAASVAKSDEAAASTLISVTYKGYTVGVVDHDLDIGTESGLQKVDIDPDHIDAEGRARSIGAKGEGVNKQIPKGEWHIVEIFMASETAGWASKWEKIATLTGALNEADWEPSITSSGFGGGPTGIYPWGLGMWLYLGATIEPLIGPYYRLTHTFVPDLINYGAIEDVYTTDKHTAKWSEETRVEGDAQTSETATSKRLKISYGPEQISRIYPWAGENNVILGRDLSTHYFTDLEL